MKKTIKKYLFLVVAIAALMVMFMSGASAKCDVCTYDSDLDVITPPTCTEDGFTTMYCAACGESMGIKDVVDATGHLFDEAKYDTESKDGGNYFYMFCICGNDNCDAKTYKTKQVGEDVVPVKYYKVNFVNPFGTKTYDTTYKDLAIEHEDVDLGTIYVEEGTAVTYTGYTPWRDKDKVPHDEDGETVYGYGAYDFIGWKDADGNLTKGNVIENITANSTFYAHFKGRDVQYSIYFKNGDGEPISKYIVVTHGKEDKKIYSLFDNNPPKKSETPLYKYKFIGWDRDISAFYASCTLMPEYETIEKEYTYVYHNSKGKEFYRVNMTASSAAPVFTEDQITAFIDKDSDDVYIYSWTDQWCYNNTPYHIITPPRQVPASLKEGDEIHLYPVYAQKAISYDLLVRISFVGTNNYYPNEGFIVQVKDANDQLVASGKTDKNGEFLCKVNYSKPLTVTVMSKDNRCSGEATVGHLFKYNVTVSNVLLDVNAALDNPSYSCNCLCHSTLIRPIWVRVLNLLYSLFNIKYVCCDDMFASIGDLLIYTK